jgi:hypothetical protein
MRHLKKPLGILAINITNTYLDLKPVVFSAARSFGLDAVLVHSDGDGRTTLPNDWILVSSGKNAVKMNGAVQPSNPPAADVRTIHPWTDNHSNLIQIVRH